MKTGPGVLGLPTNPHYGKLLVIEYTTSSAVLNKRYIQMCSTAGVYRNGLKTFTVGTNQLTIKKNIRERTVY